MSDHDDDDTDVVGPSSGANFDPKVKSLHSTIQFYALNQYFTPLRQVRRRKPRKNWIEEKETLSHDLAMIS